MPNKQIAVGARTKVLMDVETVIRHNAAKQAEKTQQASASTR